MCYDVKQAEFNKKGESCMSIKKDNNNNNQIEKIQKKKKKSMEIEGFIIHQELEATGRKLLMGELNMGDYINLCKQKARGFSHEV
jgi:hypothetical protein